MDARYIQRAESIDIVPNSPVASGEIVIRNGLVGVARLPISAGELGALALSGVFDVIKTARCSFSVGAAVFWDASRRSAVTSGEIMLGLAIQGSSVTDDKVRIVLNSGGITVNSSESSLHWQTIE